MMLLWPCSLVRASLLLWAAVVDGSMLERQDPGQSSPINFSVSFGGLLPTVYWNGSSRIQYNISTSQPISDLSIFLCQTNNNVDTIDSTNAFQVARLFSGINITDQPSQSSISSQNIASIFDLLPHGNFDPTQAGTILNFFLCFSQSPTPPICEAYSPVFDLSNPDSPPPSVATYSLRTFATGLLSVTKPNPLFDVTSTTISNVPSTSTPVTPTTLTSITYTTGVGPTTTITPTPTQSTTANQPSHSKGGLSTGALIGIIVGCVGGALILALLGLLCLRHRKHARAARSSNVHSNGPSNILLNQPYTSIGSRDIVNEKNSTSSAAVDAAPLVLPSLPTNPRHSYDSLNASAPYAGNAAAPPRARALSPNKSQLQQNQSLLSHEIPTPSLRPLPGRFGPRNTLIPTSSDDLQRGASDASAPRTVSSVGEDEYDSYRDEPIYGDTRRTPTLYQGGLPLQIFGEESMSSEEAAQLEEEERRIDAAIAAAEEDRRRRSAT